MHEVVPYGPADRQRWDQFVRESKNGTFLFERSFLEYHADRFVDASLILEDRGRIRALLPGNVRGEEFHSHQGLTYGGFVTDASMTCCEMREILTSTLSYMRDRGIHKIVYKTVPHIYHRLPAEEDRYAIVRAGGRLVRTDVLSVMSPRRPGPLQDRRRRGAKKAEAAGVKVLEISAMEEFWHILTENLHQRHGVSPVHTLQEISQLANAFPESIRLFVAHWHGRVIGGCLIFQSPMVAHVQYIATTEDGRILGALDKLFIHLLTHVYRDVPYFDFGSSTEKDGTFLNEGLIQQKEGFGSRSVVHDFFAIEL